MPELHAYYWDHWITPLGRIGLRLLVLALVLTPFVLAELRHFRRQRNLRGWAFLHAMVIVLAPLAAAPSVLIASGIEGMEALAAVYVLLFTLTPILYLAFHGVAGSLLRPRLRLLESLGIAGTSFLLLLGIFLVAAMSEGEFRAARYQARSRARDAAQLQPGPLRQVGAEVFVLPDGTRLAHVTIEPTGSFDLDRVDLLLGGRRIRGMASAASSYLCTSGNAYHLSFVATPDETPTLSYYWYRRHYPPMFESRSVPSLPDEQAARFVFSPEPKGVVRSPFPLARSAVRLDPRDVTAGRRWLERLASGPSQPPHPRACLPERMRLPDIERLRLSLNLAAGPEERLEYPFSLDATSSPGTRSAPQVD